MKKNNSSCVLLVVAFIVCTIILGIAIYMAAGLLPQAAESDFGAPRENLSGFKRIQLSVLLILNRDDLLTPQWFGGEPAAFQISAGEGASNVAYNLAYQGLIPDAESFINYLVYKGFDTAIQQGDFRIEPGLKPIEIADVLLRQEIAITILPGYRLEEVAEAVAANTAISQEEFLLFAREPYTYGISSTLPIENGVEGFLFPTTYPVTEENSTTAYLVINAMLREMEAVVTPDMIARFAANGLTVREAFIMASMIERENHINIPDEMAQMASVYYNRLSAGMLLQSDPTVQYGLRNNTGSGNWWPAITQNDYTNVNSAYNTYLNPGFPPGPICMPSLDALMAVADPAQTDYLYFRSCPGEDFHRFTATHQEHLDACP
jgi:UPF0755 protein